MRPCTLEQALADEVPLEAADRDADADTDTDVPFLARMLATCRDRPFARSFDADRIAGRLREALVGAGCGEVRLVRHLYSPQGASVVAHASGARWGGGAWVAVHTWPERGAATVDVVFEGASSSVGLVLDAGRFLGALEAGLGWRGVERLWHGLPGAPGDSTL